MSTDGSLLFITDNYQGKLLRLPSNGGVPVVLADDLAEPLDVAVMGSTLYVTSGRGMVYAVPAVGGRPEIVASDRPLIRPTGIAGSLDSSTLFIVDDAGFNGRPESAARPPAAIYALSVSDGQLQRLYSGPPLLFPPDAVLAPDGSTLFVADASYGAHGAVYRLDLYKDIAVDVEPHRTLNLVNPSSLDTITVGILATTDRQAADIDPRSVRFGPRQATESHGHGHMEDINGDGIADLVLHFVAVEAGIACGTTRATLHARTFGGLWLKGSDAVTTVCH